MISKSCRITSVCLQYLVRTQAFCPNIFPINTFLKPLILFLCYFLAWTHFIILFLFLSLLEMNWQKFWFISYSSLLFVIRFFFTWISLKIICKTSLALQMGFYKCYSIGHQREHVDLIFIKIRSSFISKNFIASSSFTF